ncbi:MAG: peptidoglycan-binding protein [Archangium sp.]|nr:peptidoglycan-binding protein [Archangium sp.]
MTLSIGSRGTSVRTLQQKLQTAGFSPGGVDGVFGRRTEQSVRAFQQSRGLEVDGKVGPQTLRALRDGFDPAPSSPTNPRRPAPVEPTQPRPQAGTNLTATFDRVRGPGSRSQQVTGRVTVNGHTYDFRSGGHGRGSLPPGAYQITPHLWSRSDRSMSVGGVGYSFAMSDKYDSRVGATRSLLRIHPDGGTPGTMGCMGIIGDASVQRQFREDMRAELQRNGGRFTLNVG